MDKRMFDLENTTGGILWRVLTRGADELTDKNLRRLVKYMIILLDEQESINQL